MANFGQNGDKHFFPSTCYGGIWGEYRGILAYNVGSVYVIVKANIRITPIMCIYWL